jgi:ribosomal protein S18 acetylase RimI-like enzyme
MDKRMAVDLAASPLTTAPDRDLTAQRSIGLRMSTPADRHLLRRIYESTRTAEFLAAGFDAETIQSLLAKQFAMQDEYYHRHYPKARFDLILAGETGIGRLYHDWSGDEARVIDIALLPDYRDKGIGTRIMKTIVAEAARRSMTLSLYVEIDNPVSALYRRLGFEATGQNGVYERMLRTAAPFEDDGFEPMAGLSSEPAG